MKNDTNNNIMLTHLQGKLLILLWFDRNQGKTYGVIAKIWNNNAASVIEIAKKKNF